MLYKPLSLSLIWTARAARELFSKKNHGPEPSAWGVACRILADEGRIPPDVGFYLVAKSCTDASNRRAPTDPLLRQITADLHWVEESYARTLGCPGWMVSSLFEDPPPGCLIHRPGFQIHLGKVTYHEIMIQKLCQPETPKTWVRTPVLRPDEVFYGCPFWSNSPNCNNLGQGVT